MRRPWIALACALLAACGGGGSGTSPAPQALTGTQPQKNTSTPSNVMTLTVVRSTPTQSASVRRAQTIPGNATSVDAKVWVGSTISGSAVSTSCVNFSAGATSATLTISVPQGTDAIQISSYAGSCSGSGGQGTTGSGSIVSQFTGTGTVAPTSTDVGVVFNAGSGISLAPFYEYPNAPIDYSYLTYLPQSVASTFQFPSINGYNGSGITVAIVIDSAINQSDLMTFLTTAGTPTTSRTITYVSVDSASTSVPGADVAEATLDTETIAGLAPGANIRVYVIPDLSGQSTVDAYDQIITDGVANIVSMSYGGCEPASTNNTATMAFANGISHNIAFIASSGDQGSTCYNNGTYTPGVNHPASDPNVIGVGGTESYAATPALNNPVAWSDSFFYNSTTMMSEPDGTGGGVSGTFSIPSYQVGIAGLASSTMRNVPDVAMPAEGVAVYLQGQWANYGGTSWSAPEFAAMLADIYSYCGRALANPTKIPYAAYAANSAAFLDVTSGNNYYSPVTSSHTYTAGVGYDNTTGLGVPYGMAVAQAVCPNHTPSSSFALAAAPLATPGPSQAQVLTAQPFSTVGTDAGAKPGTDTARVQLALYPTASIANSEQSVISTLQDAGFTIDRTFANHLIVDATATVSTVDSFFSTTLHSVVQSNGTTGYAPVGTFTIPASLAPSVASVSLENLVRLHTGPKFRPIH